MVSPRIKIPTRNSFLERGVTLPPFIWREPSFRLDPQGFVPSDPSLQKRVIDGDLQVQAYNAWVSGVLHTHSGVYGCASEPHDGKALYFAAHLVDLWLSRNPTKKAVWYTAWSSGFRNPMIEEDQRCDLLVISNLTPNSSHVTLAKVRDLLVFYNDVPRIVVIAGEDPVSFFSKRLYFKLNGLFFHSGRIMQRVVEVL